jgi:hypothetical protein
MRKSKVFVLGDSYSFHDGVPIETSWPALLPNYDSDITVINGSIPGSSLDSLFYRTLEMERLFGTPELLVVVLPYPWRIWYMINNSPLLDIKQITNQYYAPVNYQTSYIVPNSFGNIDRERLLEQKTSHSMKDLKTLYKLQSDEHHQWWRAIKEVTLLNSYYKNTVFLSWTYDYSHWLADKNVNYIGTVIDILGDNFANCKKSQDDAHFSEHGHSVFAPVIYEKIKHYLNK